MTIRFGAVEKWRKCPKNAQDEGKDGSGMYMPESTLPSEKGRFRAVQGISAFSEGGFQDGFGAISRSGRVVPILSHDIA